MDWFFDNVTATDAIIIFWAFVLSRIFYDLLKMGWERIRMERCTQCDIRIRINDKKLENRFMLDHYEKFHPKLAFAARQKYGEKEES